MLTKIEWIMKIEGFGRKYAEEVEGQYTLSVEETKTDSMGNEVRISRLTRRINGRDIMVGRQPIGGWINGLRS